MSVHRCTRDCITDYPDESNTVLADITPTQKFQVCFASSAAYHCDFGILLQIEKAVGIERSVALTALCTAFTGCAHTCDSDETLVELARLLVQNHKFTAAEIEDQFYNVEFDSGDDKRGWEQSNLRVGIAVLTAVETELERHLMPPIMTHGPNYYAAGLTGYIRGRATA